MHREREEFESRPLHYLLLFLLFSSRERLWLPDSEGRSQRGGVGFPSIRLTAECSTVELPGNGLRCAFSFYYIKQIHVMTFRYDIGMLNT